MNPGINFSLLHKNQVEPISKPIQSLMKPCMDYSLIQEKGTFNPLQPTMQDILPCYCAIPRESVIIPINIEPLKIKEPVKKRTNYLSREGIFYTLILIIVILVFRKFITTT